MTGVRFSFLIIIISVVTACSSTMSTNGSSGVASAHFDTFKVNFPAVGLPLTTKGCYVEPSKFRRLDKEKYPLYVTNEEGYKLAWCSFKANGDYIALFSFGPADCYIPVLTTYDKNGQKIDEKEIAIGGCGADCGFTCEEYMILREDYSIYTSDTITYHKCDTAGNEIPGTKEHYVVYKTGKLLNTGKIELSDEIKLPLKD